MNTKNKSRFYLMIWILSLISIGSLIGYSTKPEIDVWYKALNRSNLTPPNYVFPIAWTILYAIIGICGWLMWHKSSLLELKKAKAVYILQLILNWIWTPLFFYYHLSGVSLFVLLYMDILVGTFIWLTYNKIRAASLLMMPYLLWLTFASYLNFYIWQYN